MAGRDKGTELRGKKSGDTAILTRREICVRLNVSKNINIKPYRPNLERIVALNKENVIWIC